MGTTSTNVIRFFHISVLERWYGTDGATFELCTKTARLLYYRRSGLLIQVGPATLGGDSNEKKSLFLGVRCIITLYISMTSLNSFLFNSIHHFTFLPAQLPLHLQSSLQIHSPTDPGRPQLPWCAGLEQSGNVTHCFTLRGSIHSSKPSFV